MIVVLADDLSGAAELANVAASVGLSAEVQMEFHADTAADVVCVDTDTRSLPLPAAAARAADFARAVAAAKPAWVFKKTDSVLRGHVAAECRAVAAVLGKTRTLLVPANPSRHRIIRDGRYFVDGIPLNETAFARDPEHPRLTSSVAELLGDASGILTPEALDAADLARLASAVDEAALPAGAAEFFGALLSQRSAAASLPPRTDEAPSTPMLLVSGSASAWLGSRPAQCTDAGVPFVAMPGALFCADLREDVIDRWARSVAAALRERGRAAMVIGGHEPAPGVSSTELGTRLARAVGIVLALHPLSRLLLEGGSTASAVLRELGWKRLTVPGSTTPGVGVGRPIDRDQPHVFIKPGSYDWPGQLLRA